MKRLYLKVTSTVDGFWLAVDDVDVPIGGDGAGYIDLAPGEHVLMWWMVGEQGEGISMVGTVANAKVVERASRIPPGRFKGAGHRNFTVPA